MRNNIKIANFEISENKTFLIAEACDNHFGSLTNAKNDYSSKEVERIV